jgi:hypothetical protein
VVEVLQPVVRRAGAPPRRAQAALLAAAAALAAIYVVAGPVFPDLAAQVYRSRLFAHHGFALYDARWYAGHHLPGYSVLFPPLGALLGARAAGAVATVAAVALFDRLARAWTGGDAWLASTWFALTATTNLVAGRMTFALGMAFGIGALLAAVRGRPWVAIALAAATSLASPLAGAFLALAAAPAILLRRSRAEIGVAAAALVSAAALQVLFPDGGVFVFPSRAYWHVLAFSGLVIVVCRGQRELQLGAALYALVTIGLHEHPTAVGANIERLGTLFAGPLVACSLWPRRRLALLVVAPLLLWWSWVPLSRDAPHVRDPSTHASYFAPAVSFLERNGGSATRVEVPTTAEHWESVHVAAVAQLARGWERQLDQHDNPLFYGGRLDSRSYGAWLRANAVRYVALPDVRLDFSSRAEARLIRGRLPYLREVMSSRHWSVFAVQGAQPLLSGPGHLASVGGESFAVDATSAGTFEMRLRWSPYWEVGTGWGCVARARDGFTRLVARAPGRIEVATRFNPLRVLEGDRRCAPVPRVSASAPASATAR